jgi:AcrR family transcriptional regulator
LKNSKLGKRDGRKEDILKAAVYVFAHKGYYRATTADIAKKASISQPYVYNFFENKEELLIAALKRSWDNILEAFANVQENSEKIEQQFIVAYEKLMETHKDEILLQVQALAIREQKIQIIMQEGFRKIKDYVETRFCKAGVVDADRKVINFIARGMLCNISISLDMPDLM